MKTSFLLALQKHINSGALGEDADGRGWHCVLASAENLQAPGENSTNVAAKLAAQIAKAASLVGDTFIVEKYPNLAIPPFHFMILTSVLSDWTKHLYGRKKELERHICIYYTGIRREGAHILQEERGRRSLAALIEMRNLANSFKNLNPILGQEYNMRRFLGLKR